MCLYIDFTPFHPLHFLLQPPDQQTVIMEGMLKKKSPKGLLKVRIVSHKDYRCE